MKLTFLSAPSVNSSASASVALYRLDVLVASLSALIVAGTICTVAAGNIAG